MIEAQRKPLTGDKQKIISNVRWGAVQFPQPNELPSGERLEVFGGLHHG